MNRISTSTNTAVDPAAGYVAGANPPGWFTDGAPGVTDGTIVGAQWCNQIQEEVCNAILQDAAIVAALDVTLETQLATAIGALRALRSHATDTGSLTATHLRALLAASTSQASGAASACVASAGSVASAARAFVAGANTGSASGTNSAVIASELSAGVCRATAQDSAVLASDDGDAGGARSLVAAGDVGVATGASSATIAANTSTAAGARSAVIAAAGSSTGNGAANSAALGCDTEVVSGANCVAAACTAGEVSGTTAFTAACNNVDATGVESVAIGCDGCAADGTRSVLLGSLFARLNTSNAVAAGAFAGVLGAVGADRDLAWRASNVTGDFDTIVGGTFNSGALDYAEYFENVEVGVLPVGRLVTLVGPKVGLAGPKDRVYGVVSAAPGVTGGRHRLGWAGRFERDEFGQVIDEPVVMVSWSEIRRPSARCLAARKAVENAQTERTRWLRDAVLTALPATEAQIHARLGPSRDAWRAAWDALAPWRSSKRSMPRRMPRNEALWRRLDEARERCQIEERAFVAECRAAAATATEALHSADRECARAGEEWTQVRTETEIARARYYGPLASAPSESPEDARTWVERRYKISAVYDGSRDYVPRDERASEWTCVGLLGQIRVAVADRVESGDFLIAGPNGIGTATANGKPDPSSRRVECREILVPYDAAKGHAIAMCLVG